jgi:hypothetical protein
MHPGSLTGLIGDTLVLGLLNEALGRSLPIATEPWPNVDE